MTIDPASNERKTDGFHIDEPSNGPRSTGGNPEGARTAMEGFMRNKVGQPALDFELDDAGGQTHRLADYRGKWLLLVFHRHLG